ncbi:MAG: SCP2 sterol-binding domain-containing protein [Wenzhouxiangellaceae bacterium]|nr:SCP2 sterol-binding domain-containing protein [Wenzhouxiangellaceae bacterium]
MSRYVTPLPGMLASTIEGVVARAVNLDTSAADALKPLEGRWLKFEVEGLGIDLWIGAEGARLRVLAEPEDEGIEADTVVRGNPGALLSMAVPAFSGPASVHIEGDATLAQKFQRAMARIDPDVEKGLTDVLGPLLGPQLYRVLVEATGFGREAVRAGEDQVARWLRDESELVPRPGEWAEFSDGVDRLRDAVDRLERRARRRLDA